MSKKNLTGADALRQACIDSPTDLDARLIYADALEDSDNVEAAAFQRLLVKAARLILARDKKLSMASESSVAGIEEGPKNVRLFIQYDTGDDHRSLLCWVRKSDGAMLSGSWKGPKGPVKAWLSAYATLGGIK